MQPPFLKKFDFRGIYEKDITDKDAYYLALALCKTFPLKKILLGWDTRASSQNLAYAFISALKDTAIEISYMDLCPIDYVTAAAYTSDFDLSIMFTGSHHPWTWTGLLIHTKGGKSLSPTDVKIVIKHYIASLSLPYTKTQISLSDYHNYTPTLEKLYREKIQTLIPLTKIQPLKILVDIGDGSGYKSLDVLETLLPQVTFSRINDRRMYDEKTSHIADPSDIENMQELIAEMKEGIYDGGFAFDSDADRVLAVDETGEYLNGSLMASGIVEASENVGLSTKRIGYAVDCGPSLQNTAQNAFPIPVGRSLVRQLLFEDKLDIGAENVGHFYIKDFFMTDSAVYVMAVILYWMSTHTTLSKLALLHPDGNRDQHFVKLHPQSEEEKETFLNTIKAALPGDMKEVSLDGTRLEFHEHGIMKSWVCVRTSGYEAISKYYFGSLDEHEFEKIKKIFKESIK